MTITSSGATSALRISPEMMREIPLESVRQAMELLFLRPSEELGFVPVEWRTQ